MAVDTYWQNAKKYRYLPEHLLSRLLGSLASANAGFASQCAMKKFSQHYNIDFSDVKNPDLSHYKNFNDFFTRELKPEARPIAAGANTIVSPVDGTVYAKRALVQDINIEAKGAHFTVNALLGGDEAIAQQFSGGDFTTIYLAPKDYHRIHMPFTGSLTKMIYIPGRLFSVQPKIVEKTNQLFARNERVVCLFDTEFGPMAVVLVGAMIVGSMKTAWHGVVKAKDISKPHVWTYKKGQVELNKGDELGQFLLGSTVILLFPKDIMQFSAQFKTGKHILMGSELGEITNL